MTLPLCNNIFHSVKMSLTTRVCPLPLFSVNNNDFSLSSLAPCVPQATNALRWIVKDTNLRITAQWHIHGFLGTLQTKALFTEVSEDRMGCSTQQYMVLKCQYSNTLDLCNNPNTKLLLFGTVMKLHVWQTYLSPSTQIMKLCMKT